MYLQPVVTRRVAQTARHLDTVGLERGWLVVFDVRAGRSWDDRLWERVERVEAEGGDKQVVVLGA